MGGGYSNRVVSQILLAFVLFCCCIQYPCSGEDDGSTPTTTTTVRCRGTEREALLGFRRGLRDPANRLSSWVGEDCCRWEGIHCSNRTDHVHRLDLHNPRPYIIEGLNFNGSLGGEIRPSLLGLTHLAHLDLSYNFLDWGRIPSFIGSFRRLRYLNLSAAGFIGEVPRELGNLSRLTHIDLSQTWYTSMTLSVHDAQWLSGLTSLQHLDLGLVNFSKATNWLQSLSVLPSVHEIILPYCSLTRDSFLSVHHVNFTSLTHLDLSFNTFNSTIPDWLFSLRGLQSLGLSYNALSGPIPSAIGELKQLSSLYLEHNTHYGPIPASLGRLSSLQYLDLSGNNLNDTVPESIGGLSNLINLYLSENSLEGVLSEAHFTNLTRLIRMDIGHNPQLAFKVGPNWDPSFQLQNIWMDSCKLGPLFPAWLRTQDSLTWLSASVTGISDAMPEWFWNWSTQLEYLDLSNNNISGTAQFLPSNATTYVDLSNNSFYGPIPRSIGENLPNLEYLYLSQNDMNGSVPNSLCKMRQLTDLDLSINHFSGEAPDCWDSLSALQTLDFSNNNLCGGIPGSICSSSTNILHLGNNNLSGNILLSMRNCTGMHILDIAHNMLSGSIPTWLGNNLSSLVIISLRSNMFTGHIPPQLSQLTALQILDLAHNNLSGTIPNSFGNFSNLRSTSPYKFFDEEEFGDHILLDTKGTELKYSYQILPLEASIDLSDNRLSGDIPEELGNLHGLHNLNLSGNYLTGHITTKIGDLKQLESLDLSRNKLSGEIPSSLSELTFLAHLNLSYNNLSGRIPSGNQLQTLNEQSIYIGNPDLCGLPLIKKCQDDETPRVSVPVYGGDEESEMQWLYSGLAPGFVVGICTVWGVFVFEKTWRVAFYGFTDNIYDKVYVVAVGMTKLNRKLLDAIRIRDRG